MFGKDRERRSAKLLIIEIAYFSNYDLFYGLPALIPPPRSQVPRTVTVMEPGQTTFKQVCDTVTEYQQACRTIMVSTTVNIPTKRCEPATEKKCVPIKIPNVQIVSSFNY